MISRLANGVDRALAGIAGAALAGILCAILWQVVSRSLLGTPSSFTDELARFLGVWLGLLAAGAALGRGSHVALHWLADRQDSRHAVLSQRCAAAAGLIFAVAVLILGGLRLIVVTGQVGPQSAALGIPLAVVYTALPVAGIAIALRSAATLASPRDSATGSER
ncbi:MAG: TRAP transporter small permease subunit [Myxococcota bacterium]